MKKRIISIALIGLLMMALSSCGASRGSGGGHCPAYGN